MPNICFFTENSHIGYVPRDYHNMRTEFAWICATGAYHWPLDLAQKISCDVDCDLGIVILPKKKEVSDALFNKLRSNCKKLAVMQEGPFWYYQDYSTKEQLRYLDRLKSCDFLLSHSYADNCYFSGLVDLPTYIMPALMITDNIGAPTRIEDRKEIVLINGNLTSWYSGIDALIIAEQFDCEIWMPTMGRRQDDEYLLRDRFPNLKQVPYYMWGQWMQVLKNVKYAVNCMRTFAAGTFSLNCAHLGIPCIGYAQCDTQDICFPDLSFDIGQLREMKILANTIRMKADLYERLSVNAIFNQDTFCSEKTFMTQFNRILTEQKIAI